MLKCSHILCKVENIHDCVRQLEQAGFTVQWGSDPARAHNALVWFEHGPFLEFFELPRRFRWISTPFGWRFGRSAGQRLAAWATAASGWCDIALEPQHAQPESPLSLAPVITHLQQQALGASRVVNGSRLSCEGEKVHYRFMTPHSVHLPFIVSHYHPAQRPERVTHANGARAVMRVDMHLPAADYGQLQRLLPEDRWLHSHIDTQRQIGGVTLQGWRRLPETSAFIYSLFTAQAQEK